MSQFKDVQIVGSDERIHCTECGERLKKAVWLELQAGTTYYSDVGDIAEDQSQGWHPFGVTCAKKKIRGE